MAVRRSTNRRPMSGGHQRYESDPGDSFLTGIAKGGPRDGVKLSASYSWDGVVYYGPTSQRKWGTSRDGHYTWDGETWVWGPPREVKNLD